MEFTDHITVIKGIGEKSEKLFAKLGILSVEDLLNHYPRSYEVFGLPVPIKDMKEGVVEAVEASVASLVEIKKIKNLQVISCRVKDRTGVLILNWYNQPYLKNTLRFGNRSVFRGKIVRKNGMLVMEQPKIYKQEDYRRLLHLLQPVYPLTDGITNHAISKAVDQALAGISFPKDYLPKRILKEYDFMQRKAAFQEIHFPKDREVLLDARRRLVFDEFFLFTMALMHMKENKSIRYTQNALEKKEQTNQLIQMLPYQLTGAQYRVWEEISKDLANTICMNRLVQGDVGSGAMCFSYINS